MLCSLPGVRLWELELAMVGTPLSQLVDLMTAGSTNWWVGCSFLQGSFTLCGWLKGSLSFGAGPKESLSHPQHHNISGPKGGGGKNVGSVSSHRPLWGHHWPLRTLYAPSGAARVTSHPLPHPSTHTSCQILQASQLEGLQQNIHLCAVWKAYLKLGLSHIPLPSGVSGGQSSLSLVWDELFGSLKVLSPCREIHNLLFY